MGGEAGVGVRIQTKGSCRGRRGGVDEPQTGSCLLSCSGTTAAALIALATAWSAFTWVQLGPTREGVPAGATQRKAQRTAGRGELDEVLELELRVYTMTMAAPRLHRADRCTATLTSAQTQQFPSQYSRRYCAAAHRGRRGLSRASAACCMFSSLSALLDRQVQLKLPPIAALALACWTSSARQSDTTHDLHMHPADLPRQSASPPSPSIQHSK